LTLSGTLRKNEVIPTLTINPAYDTQARLSLVQPVLKGFGPTVFAQKVVFASSDKQIALQDLRQKAFDIVAAVRNAYLEALQSQYELSYRETSVELARRIVQENNARVEAGILAPVERLEAEVGLQTRERLLLDSQRNFDDAVDQFNLLINAEETIYLPVIQSFNMNYQTSEESGIQAGLMNRPDVIRRMKEIEKVRTERTIARNSLLPELDVVASYTQNGLSDNADDSIDITKDGDYDSWEVGVQFSYPLGSIESRNEVKRSEIRLRQERALLTQLHNEVRRDVRSAIRNIDVSRKKTEVAKRGHDLSQEKLRILLKSREVGLATTRDVLDGEEDLASARTDQIASVADYFKAVTDYLRVTGTLLESENIVFEGDVSPDIERIPFYRR
jgi:outer membrane protein TolC